MTTMQDGGIGRDGRTRTGGGLPAQTEQADDLGALVFGGGGPAMKFAGDALAAMSYRCIRVETITDALVTLHTDWPDVVLVDTDSSATLLSDFRQRLVPLLVDDRVPIVWMGGGRSTLDQATAGVAEVVLDKPFTAADLAEALAASRWAHADDKPHIGGDRRRTQPIEIARMNATAAPAVARQSRRKTPPTLRRKTGRYSMPAAPDVDNAAPRRGSGSHTQGAMGAMTIEGATNDERGFGGAAFTTPRTDPMAFATPVPRTKPSGPGLRMSDSPTLDARGNLRAGVEIAGRYEVVHTLGHGGMARVYKVLDRELSVFIALKLLRGDLGDDEADSAVAGERFRREMRICRQLVHPNIVRTYEFGTWQDRLYYTMELLDGHDMAAYSDGHSARPPLYQLLELMAQACEAIGSAHAIGVIHRDIKPHNLYVVDDGAQVKVTDFGIAKGQGEMSHTITLGDHVVGTPAYLAPERLRDDSVDDASADVYSLGATMYHLFTGRLPFEARDLSGLLTSIVMDEPTAPRKLNPMLPSTLERVVERAMAKDPANRYRSCIEVRDALLTIQREVGDI